MQSTSYSQNQMASTPLAYSPPRTSPDYSSSRMNYNSSYSKFLPSNFSKILTYVVVANPNQPQSGIRMMDQVFIIYICC